MLKLKTKTDKNPLNTILIVYFRYARLFRVKYSRTNTIHPGIFGGRKLCADSVSSRMNTVASRAQFKPIRIGENLVRNYKG